MSLAELTPEAVHQAITEFNRLGRKTFLSTYGFGKARDYFLMHKGQAYDSKAIAGVAHQYLPGRVALKSDELYGGKGAAAHRLRELGFNVRGSDEQIISAPAFEPGGIYNRMRDIHNVYGGQEQGGISTPKAVPLVFLFTGETGEQYGYRDGPRDDGVFAYTGDGQIGDMMFERSTNRAVRDHIKDGRDILLFEILREPGSVRFVGNFAYNGFEYATAPDRNGDSRQVIVFHLRPAVSGSEPEVVEAADSLYEKSLEELRRQAIADAAYSPKRGETRRSSVKRSASVRACVLKRAGGTCESCEKSAPFMRSNGEPYLEPHHIRRLADGGPDHPRWVAAICPTCHREIHHGEKGRKRNEDLEERIAVLETEAET